MSLIGNETFLPGVLTEVQSDYSYGYDSSEFGTTDSVLLIGTAFNGPVGVPVAVYSPEHARYIFGKPYDSRTKREATLVPAIEDAYQRGCRTIYAVRIGGKEVKKDYALAVDTDIKLRVSSVYPTNEAKDFFMVYDNTDGNERIKIYKPAERATIQEKMQGLVESDESVIEIDIALNQDYGVTKDSELTRLIEIVNGHQFNNVLRLELVPGNAMDSEEFRIESRSLPVGALFPGLYMIGRDKTLLHDISTNVKYNFVKESPFSGFDTNVVKEIIFNTDVDTPYPIYAKNMEILRETLRRNEISMYEPFDFLKVAGVVDRAFKKDNVDYEEVGLSNFEIYKRLGGGFAITAKAELRENADGKEEIPKVKETPVGDANRVVPIEGGIYSILENMNARYRVLTCVNAESSISGRLPKADDFLVTLPKTVDLLKGHIRAIPILDEEDTFQAKSYSFTIESLEHTFAGEVDEIYPYGLKVVPSVDKVDDLIDMNVPDGTVVMVLDDETGQGTLYRFGDGNIYEVGNETLVDEMFIVNNNLYMGVIVDGSLRFAKVDPKATPELQAKKFVIAEANGNVFAFEILDGEEFHFKPLGDLETMLSQDANGTSVYAPSNYGTTNTIIIRSEVLDSTTLEEFVDMLNNHKSLRGLFKFELTSEGVMKKDEYVLNVVPENELDLGTTLSQDRVRGYDYNKYIPFKSTDNFARHLAQHCTYTSLKTAPTHGIIGTAPLADTGLKSVAEKVEAMLKMDFDMYAKNIYGRNMLDRNNMPYPIGKNVSIVFTQYPVYMDDGYQYVSNGAAGYAGMVSTLPLDTSSTNQPINVNELSYELTNYQLTRLTQKGYVTIKRSFTRGNVITDGITMAPVESPFRRLATTRVIGAVEDLIRQATEPFIGKQNHIANRNSIKTAIKSNLEKIKGTLIEAYEFNLVVNPRLLKFSQIDIDYKIVPIHEIREIRNRISVREKL